jgi:hypothetical protein
MVVLLLEVLHQPVLWRQAVRPFVVGCACRAMNSRFGWLLHVSHDDDDD